MIGELGNLKPFCSCLGWWCRAQQLQKVQEGLQVKLPELTLAMGWRRRWQPTTSLWMWLFHRLRYNNGAADERSAASVPSSSIFVVQILLSPTLVLLTKILLGHHPLRDFIPALYATVGIRRLPHLCLRVPSLGFLDHRFQSHNRYVSILFCISCMSLVESETKTAERFRTRRLARETSTILKMIQV